MKTTKVTDMVTDKVIDKVIDKVTDNQQLIIEHIRANPTVSASQLAEKIGISERKILDNINK